MDEKLKKALELALKTKGLKEGLSKFITVSKEEEIETAIGEYVNLSGVEVLTPEQMMELPAVKSKIDGRITGAVNTNTQNLAKKYNFDPAKEPEIKKPEPTEEMPAWAKQLLDDNKALTTKLETFETQKTVEQKRSEAIAKLKTSTVISDSFKDKWGNRIDVNSEVPVEDQIKGLETEYTELQQAWANETGYSGKPGTGAGKQEASAEDISAIVGNVLS